MNKGSYFFFFISLAFALGITILIGYLSFHYVYDISRKELIEGRITANKQEAIHMARLLAQKLKAGYSQEQVITEFQNSIQYTPIDKGFECMFNQKGVQLCHPDPNKIGRIIDSTNSVVNLMNNQQFKENFEHILQKGNPTGGVRTFFKGKYTEIIYVAPVEGSNLMVAVHANLVYINNQLDDFREKLLYVFIIAGLLTALVIFVFIRFLNLHFQNRHKILWEGKTPNPVNPAFLSKPSDANTETKETKPVQNRLLVQQGTKMIPVLINDIAYVYIEHKQCYIVKTKGERFTSELSMDELFNQMNPEIFIRANRQFILSIQSISKVERYGNSQLRVKLNPPVDKEVIISKTKMTEFKKWMGQN